MINKKNGAANVEKVYRMSFASIYPMYIQKVERKGKTKEEVDTIIKWLTGYNSNQIYDCISNNVDLETFFVQAPMINPNVKYITGSICGYKVEEIENVIIRNVRYLDILIDELSKNKDMDKILRKWSIILLTGLGLVLNYRNLTIASTWLAYVTESAGRYRSPALSAPYTARRLSVC